MNGDENAKELHRREQAMFARKQNLDMFRQECALQFRPERADFISPMVYGREFAEHLFDGAPLIDCRTLSDAFSSTLRPGSQQWFRAGTDDEELNKWPPVARVLDHITSRMRTLMYHPPARFVQATKEADQDIAPFGNYVLSTDLNSTGDALLYRDHHLRDCAWARNADVQIDLMFRRENMAARNIAMMFKGVDLHQDIKDALERTSEGGQKNPDQEFPICHVMMPSDDYEYYKKPAFKAPFVSIYYDSMHKTLLRERPSYEFRYGVGEWQTVSGWPYSISPPVMASISDARGAQVMAAVLLDAGELALLPPTAIVSGAVLGDVNLFAGGVTRIDSKYDQRTGSAIEVIKRDTQTGIGIELIMRSAAQMKDAWFLNKLTLPPTTGHVMTAFETQARIEEFVRANIPLFEPMETNNGRLLEATFSLLLRLGAFGDMRQWPRELLRSEIKFMFSNPLRDTIKRNLVNQTQTAIGLMAGVEKLDPNAKRRVDIGEMLSDAISGSGAPASWLRDPAIVAQEIAAEKQQQAMQAEQGNVLAGLSAANQAAGLVNQGADAAGKLRELALPIDRTAPYGPT